MAQYHQRATPDASDSQTFVALPIANRLCCAGSHAYGLEQGQKDVVVALGCFRAGAVIPFALVKLAVEVDTQKGGNLHNLQDDLDKIVVANLVEEYEEEHFVKASEGRKGYQLPDLVAMRLTQCREPATASRFFQGPPATVPQDSQLLSGSRHSL